MPHGAARCAKTWPADVSLTAFSCSFSTTSYTDSLMGMSRASEGVGRACSPADWSSELIAGLTQLVTFTQPIQLPVIIRSCACGRRKEAKKEQKRDFSLQIVPKWMASRSEAS